MSQWTFVIPAFCFMDAETSMNILIKQEEKLVILEHYSFILSFNFPLLCPFFHFSTKKMVEGKDAAEKREKTTTNHYTCTLIPEFYN